ncbi:hypothetical protein CLIM01_13066 [Colletotrichum limetticola]|uniref:MARVEL domain-containing protein n=1 Tax=Colletotrichum limetticola TaxID=1209924 RepID=A0ABQ9PCD0_9PEZI|nr:hypothetical protein CLIM01_13066 [Colletotrichum limetticola]
MSPLVSLTKNDMPDSSHKIAEVARLRRSYPTLNLATAVSGITAALMLANRSSTTTSVLSDMSTCLLVGSIITAAFTGMITIMLSFELQRVQETTRVRQAMAWVPIFFFDLMVFELVMGLVFWFTAEHAWQYAAVLGLLSGSLFMIAAAVAVWVTLSASLHACLRTREETEPKG